MTTEQHKQVSGWQDEAERLKGFEYALRKILENPANATEIAREALGEK